MDTRSLSPGLMAAMEDGVKLKMPVGLLGHATRSQNVVDNLRKTGGVEGVVRSALQKFESDLDKLKEACALIKPADPQQEAAKEAWMSRNISQKEKYLAAMQELFETPRLQLNNEDVEQLEERRSVHSLGGSRHSARSGASSAARLARAEATAKIKALEVEMAHQQRKRQLEEQERQLRLQIEEEEMQMKLRQAKIVEQALAFDRDDEEENVEQGELEERPNVMRTAPPPTYLPPVSTWAPRQQESNVRGPAVTGWTPHPRLLGNPTEGLLQHVLLPQSSLPTFKGDPLDFLWFLKAFEMRVEAVTTDPIRRLHLLLQHLEGDAKTLVMGCQLSEDAAVGYARAKDKLIQKYGNRIRQALAFKAKLLAWPNIKKDSVLDLERFSVQLELCSEVKMAGGLAELDAAGTILQLMHKLPMKMQEAWQMRAHKIETIHFREADFSDFCRFVSDLAAARNHPVYGNKQDGVKETKRTARTLTVITDDQTGGAAETRPVSVAATSLEAHGTKTTTQNADHGAFSAPCLLCDNNHPTDKCRKAAQMSIRERRSKLGSLCFACLKGGHTARNCTEKAVCQRCQGAHPTVLHFERPNEGKVEKKTGDLSADTTDKRNEAKACVTAHSTQVAVAVVPVKVWYFKESQSHVVNAILDPGSTATFVTSSLIERFGVTPKQGSVNLTTLAKKQETLITSIVSGIKVKGLEMGRTITLPPAYTVDVMPYQKNDLAMKADTEPWTHLNDVPFDWHPEAEVELLIGMNCPDALKPLKVVDGGEDEPYAIQTTLGWCLNGPLKREGHQKAVLSNLIRAEQITLMLDKLHQSDFEHAYDFESKAPSQDDRHWLRIADGSITKAAESSCGQYELALPFRDETPPLVDNRSQALQRLQSLKKKFAANAQFKLDYVAFMENMLNQGYVEKVDYDNNDSPSKVISYVPHHGVYHPKKPGKIRVVFNCSSKYDGISLNDCLIPGPDMTNSLLGVLIRFRQERIAFMADIESMFYRVFVPARDRDALRYLWWPGGVTTEEPTTFRMKVHLFGATSSPSCANYTLRRTAEDALAKGLISSDVCKAVKSNFYVDDCLKSERTESEAIKMAEGLIKACWSGGFRLTKFVSSSIELLNTIPPMERAKGLHDVDLSGNKHDPLGQLQERALGVSWDVTRDVFKASVITKKQDKITKRNLLAVLSSVYDPIGMVAPVVIRARILFRDLTKEPELGWDDSLSETSEAAKRWRTWTTELPQMNDVEIPRCFRPKPEMTNANASERTGAWQLHVFCDASGEAFAAVAYLRQCREEEMAHVAFVMGKARVTPSKIVTIPRLELTAAKLAAEVAATIERELQYEIESRTFWTDSQTVLKYLSNNVRRFHTFVANRVCSILASTRLEEWRHVPTDLNPADEGSRGSSPHDLKKGLWLTGPEFLKRSKEEWPMQGPKEPVSEDDPEVHTLATKTAQNKKTTCFTEELAVRHSSFKGLVQAVAVWKSFLRHVSVRNRSVTTRCSLEDARHSLIRNLQQAQWPAERTLIERGDRLPKSSPLYKLQPCMKEGMLFASSRIRDELPIIPGSTRTAWLIVQRAHERQLHFGRQATASQTLKEYWVVGLNKLVRRVIKECVGCQRRLTVVKMPQMGELPPFRIHANRAFETTGVDYFGPFVIKRARTEYKAYGVIFTCATTRAVHLEVSEDLSTSSFLNALRRFVARRGHVRRLVSDNGTNFVGAEASLTQELQRELNRLKRDSGPIEKWLANKEIKWSFNPPGASHQGGFWERLIRSIRRALAVLLPTQRPLTYDGLVTVLCEIEAVLNNRPLTPVSEDIDDYDALTPNHLLLGSAGPAAPPGDFKRAAIPLKKQWRQVQHVANCFWKRWLTEYRTLLHQRSKWYEDEDKPLKPNDVVLVIDSVRPREYWPLGRVMAAHPGKDGRVRVVTVKTSKGLLKRPVSKVCKLEIASDSCQRDAHP